MKIWLLRLKVQVKLPSTGMSRMIACDLAARSQSPCKAGCQTRQELGTRETSPELFMRTTKHIFGGSYMQP
ncbi:MAG TPA: hypothetical protein VFF81_05835 [Noviherbaspirillum sp.]|nr:hypothetical protein [Noviherbaspirillum sp.]